MNTRVISGMLLCNPIRCKIAKPQVVMVISFVACGFSCGLISHLIDHHTIKMLSRGFRIHTVKVNKTLICYESDS